jgi:hypothetical protein
MKRFITTSRFGRYWFTFAAAVEDWSESAQ